MAGTDANANMRIDSSGYALLRLNEGVKLHYYNDAPRNGNCTWGVGTLAHYGPCTTEELHRVVKVGDVNAVLMQRAGEAARIVRTLVKDHPLTQAQFNAAVSFAYNSRTQDIRAVLAPANRGDMKAVADLMMARVYVHPRDRHGNKIGPAVLANGLLIRRQREAAPFSQERK